MSTTKTGLVAVEGGGVCGAVSWWALSGLIDASKFMDAFDDAGLDVGAYMPELPSAESAAKRAARECQDKRTLVRPLDQRGMWEIVTESVVSLEAAAPTLAFGFECRVEVLPNKMLLVSPDTHPFADRIRAGFQLYRRSYTPSDISDWLTVMVGHVQGVSLRDRGGLYFIPETHMELWRSLAAVLTACSAHVVYEMPSMRTEKAVEAILTAVRSDAERELLVMEEYMARPPETTSTRGLNAYARTAAHVRTKLEHYATLLGVALPDMVARAENLAAVIAAAHLIAKGPGA